jgi:hypothetical protein
MLSSRSRNASCRVSWQWPADTVGIAGVRLPRQHGERCPLLFARSRIKVMRPIQLASHVLLLSPCSLCPVKQSDAFSRNLA